MVEYRLVFVFIDDGKEMAILDGQVLASEILDTIEDQVRKIRGRAPSLAVILIGKDPSSQVYVTR